MICHGSVREGLCRNLGILFIQQIVNFHGVAAAHLQSHGFMQDSSISPRVRIDKIASLPGGQERRDGSIRCRTPVESAGAAAGPG